MRRFWKRRALRFHFLNRGQIEFDSTLGKVTFNVEMQVGSEEDFLAFPTSPLVLSDGTHASEADTEAVRTDFEAELRKSGIKIRWA